MPWVGRLAGSELQLVGQVAFLESGPPFASQGLLQGSACEGPVQQKRLACRSVGRLVGRLIAYVSRSSAVRVVHVSRLSSAKGLGS